MIAIEEGEDERSIVTPCCRLVFRRDGERWTHSLISLPTGERLLESLESDPDRDDPMRVISPSFQDLHFQDSREGLVLAMLVGQSGPHHFSAVFQVEMVEGPIVDGVPVRPGSNCQISADVAVRSRSAFESLTSTYSVSGADACSERIEKRIAIWRFAAGDLGVVVGSNLVPAGRFPNDTPAAILSIVDQGEGKYQASLGARLQPSESTKRYGYFFMYSNRQQS